MPPRRQTRGRHRRPKNTGGPAYVTAATLAAFTVSGVNVPNALGDARHASATASTVTAAATPGAALQISAAQLRETLAAQQAERASRLRSARSSMVAAAQEATEEARRIAELRRPKWVLPVENFRLTAGFGDYGLWSSMHTGQDFAAPYGTPVRAVGDGVIVSAGYEGAYGNKIVIKHPDGTETWYAHMSSFVLTSGPVKAGEVIGRVGSTGNSTGDHLHLEVRPGGGDAIDPLPWLRRHGLSV